MVRETNVDGIDIRRGHNDLAEYVRRAKIIAGSRIYNSILRPSGCQGEQPTIREAQRAFGTFLLDSGSRSEDLECRHPAITTINARTTGMIFNRRYKGHPGALSPMPE